MVLFTVVGKGRKPPSAPELGTPQDDVCCGRFGNVQLSRVGVTDLSQKTQRVFRPLSHALQTAMRSSSSLCQTYRWGIRKSHRGGYCEETQSHCREMKGFCGYDSRAKGSKTLLSTPPCARSPPRALGGRRGSGKRAVLPSKGTHGNSASWQLRTP